MAEGQGSRVGRIGRFRRLTQAEQRSDHRLHLGLVGSAIAGDGRLHLIWRVLSDIGTTSNRLGDDKTGHLGHADGGAHVVLEENSLDRDDGRMELAHQASHLALDLGEPMGRFPARGRGNHADGNGATTAPGAGLDHCIATPRKARIYSQNEHLYDGSASPFDPQG